MAESTIAIVGANAAGATAAETLRSEGFAGRVVLIGEEPWRPYDRPALSKQGLQTAPAVEPEFLHDENFYVDQRIDLRLGVRVDTIDRSRARLVLSDGGELEVAQVILCTGSRLRRLAVPGADLDGVAYLRTHGDALALGARLNAGTRVVLVGYGVIGSEVAACAVKRGCKVVAIESGAVPMLRAVGRRVGNWLAAKHMQRGVDLRLQTGVRRILGRDGVVVAVESTLGERIDADLVIVGIGTSPGDELAREAGLNVSDGIVVDSTGRTSCPEIFAAGDVANRVNLFGVAQRSESFCDAQDQAAVAAAAAAGSAISGEPAKLVPYAWSEQFDLNIQVAGQIRDDTTVVARGDMSSERFSLLYLRDGCLEGLVAINRPADVAAGKRLIQQRWQGPPGSLADVNMDLRRLLLTEHRSTQCAA